MTGSPVPEWQVVLRWADGVRAVTRYTGSLWVGPMTQGVHQLALASYAQRRTTEPGLPERMPYLILSFIPLAPGAGTTAAVKT